MGGSLIRGIARRLPNKYDVKLSKTIHSITSLDIDEPPYARFDTVSKRPAIQIAILAGILSFGTVATA